jgi:hypothetical protein
MADEEAGAGCGACGIPDHAPAERLTRVIDYFASPDAACAIPPAAYCFLRKPENVTAMAVGFEFIAMMRLWPGGVEHLNAMAARWKADPEGSAAALRELMMRPVPTSPATDDRPWPGHYL